MTAKNFIRKIISPYLWLNLVAMAVIVVLLSLGLRYGLDLYTHHGQTVEVPTILHKTYNEAEDMLDQVHLQIVVSDTDYVKTLPPDCVLEQSPTPGDIVKPGRIVYVKINASQTPRRPLPDVIDNSSLRDAQSKLLAMGFLLGDPEYIPGEREWVYGIKCQGKQLSNIAHHTAIANRAVRVLHRKEMGIAKDIPQLCLSVRQCLLKQLINQHTTRSL